MEKVNRLQHWVIFAVEDGFLYLRDRYFESMFQQCIRMHNFFKAIKVAHIRWDEEKCRFSPAKTTHFFNLLFLIGLALTVTFIMIHKV